MINAGGFPPIAPNEFGTPGAGGFDSTPAPITPPPVEEPATE